MKLLYLYADFHNKPNEPEIQKYGLCVGNENEQLFISVEYQEWFDLLKELSKKRKIVDRSSVPPTPFIYRMRYFL